MGCPLLEPQPKDQVVIGWTKSTNMQILCYNNFSSNLFLDKDSLLSKYWKYNYINIQLLFNLGQKCRSYTKNNLSIYIYGGPRHKRAEIAFCVTFLLGRFHSQFFNASSDHQTERSYGKKSKNAQHALSQNTFYPFLYAVKLRLKIGLNFSKNPIFNQFSIAILQHIEKDKRYFETMCAVLFCFSFCGFFSFDDQSLH